MVSNSFIHIPQAGFLRLPQVLQIIPVGKSTWWAGIKSGRFPQGVKLGPRTTAWRVEDIRQLLLQHRDEKVDAYTELLLMFASRRQHVENVIRPALAEGKWVICDRFTDASFAYQGFGRGLNQDFISSLKHWVHGDLNPGMTLLFDLDIAVGMERAGKRSASDRIETETISFFERVRQGYLTQAQAELKRYRIIDASKSIAQVECQLNLVLEPLIATVGN